MGRLQCKTAAYSDYTLEQLLLFLEKRLDLDARLAILEHLDECNDCFEEVYRICKNQDARHLVWPKAKHLQLAPTDGSD
jgi:hypothetical protein